MKDIKWVGSSLLIMGLALGGCSSKPETETTAVTEKQPKQQQAEAKQEGKPEKASEQVKETEIPEQPVRFDRYTEYPDAQLFIEEMKSEGFSEAYLTEVLNQAKRQESILEAISRPAEGRLTWGRYRKIFIEPKRISQGVKFWQENRDVLVKAEKTYGVPAEIIVAIIGVETRYGRITGSYRVLDALATLGFDYPRRSKFFRGQLKEYLRLVREESVDVTSLKGSYAGAMGYGQFIPSSYRNYAVDFDQDGQRDIWNNKTDAIGSVANYFAEHGWKKGEPVISAVSLPATLEEDWFGKGRKGLTPKVTLGEWQERGVTPGLSLSPEGKATLLRLEIEEDKQYWLGLHNFYVITRYNHSNLYAMAVYRLSEKIKQAYNTAN
ncbi:lytic murein transglycosylase B [Neptuniibacter sp.]|uniref:lytic murein transglycosylase B n=1 Tax=Neptuniibacter sp. TaxID=1962643 RepID=UPI003B58D0CF